MSEPSADAMYRASVEALAAAAQIGDGPIPPSADALRQSMMALLADFVARCRNARIPDDEIAEARYAIVAFIDDRVLRSNWAGRTEWMSNPLQLQFFREYTAGENFARMRALGQRGAPFWALEVYYTCIALGFVERCAEQPVCRAPARTRSRRVFCCSPGTIRPGLRRTPSRWRSRSLAADRRP